VSRYTSATESDRRQMLEAIGVDSIEAVFESIPAGLRLDRPLDLPAGLSEAEVYEHLRRPRTS
jgi:glycine cleavage system P protein (glycine dehydrogenase) subunit 1